jgi:hypothetical protein
MTKTLMFDDMPENPNQTKLDAIMHDVSRQLGETWTGAIVDGSWMLWQGHPGQAGPHISRKSLMMALRDATGCTIINDVSF